MVCVVLKKKTLPFCTVYHMNPTKEDKDKGGTPRVLKWSPVLERGNVQKSKRTTQGMSMQDTTEVLTGISDDSSR